MIRVSLYDAEFMASRRQRKLTVNSWQASLGACHAFCVTFLWWVGQLLFPNRACFYWWRTSGSPVCGCSNRGKWPANPWSGVGKYSPDIPPFRMTTRGVPPLEIHQYIYFTLHKHYFIGGLKKHVHKNVRNKIYIKYQALENIRRGRSR